MEYKADWPEAVKRLSALWYNEPLDRPCIALTAPREPATPAQPPDPANDEARWLDPSHVVAAARHKMATTWWGGEAVPSFLPLSGWMVSLGGAPRFNAQTIWFETMAGEIDFTRASPFRHDNDNPWVTKYRNVLNALSRAAGKDGFLVGQPSGLPANDLLSMHMGTEAFMFALMDHPEWMENAIITGARDILKAKCELQSTLREKHDFWYGIAGWAPYWAPEPFTVTQSDVSCMLSPELFDRFVVPELTVYAGENQALWYHLDGGNALQHLPRLLSLPYIKVIQYVPAPFERKNGPAHLELYRTIQAAGKIVHLTLPVENIEPLVRELDPSRLMLQTHCESREQGEALLKQMVLWTHLSRRLAA